MSWDDRYEEEGFLFGKNPALGLTRQEHHLVPQGPSLLIADGEGRNSVYLAGKGYPVTAMDSSKVGIAKATELAAEHDVSVTFELADIFDYDWQARQYENVAAIFIQFAPPTSWEIIFSGMVDALAPGGTLFIHGYTRKQISYGTGGPPYIDHLYEPELLADLFSKIAGDSLDILVNDAYEADIRDGKGHKGQSALIDFVARKRQTTSA